MVLCTINSVQIEKITGIENWRLHLMVIFQKKKLFLYIIVFLFLPTPKFTSFREAITAVRNRLEFAWETKQLHGAIQNP